MRNIPGRHYQKVTEESLLFSPDPMIWQLTPTKWTALWFKLFNCSLISFIILLIQISAVSSERKICISWIILTWRPFNFRQQYFIAPIRECSQWCCSPLGMSEDSALVTAPNHLGAVKRHCGNDYYLWYSCISLLDGQTEPLLLIQASLHYTWDYSKDHCFPEHRHLHLQPYLIKKNSVC